MLPLAALLLSALLTSEAAAQLPEATAEGGSDVYLPTSEQATKALAEGDRHLQWALEESPAADLEWTAAFEAWRDALARSRAGDSVPGGVGIGLQDQAGHFAERWPDRDNSFARRTEAVEIAVERRLAGIDSRARAQWTSRFETLASERLRAARGTSRSRRLDLATLERSFPATRAATRAALELFGLEFEVGRAESALNWLERAERHAALAAWDGVRSGIDARRAALLELTRTEDPAPLWPTATEIVPKTSHNLVLPNFFKPSGFARIEGPPGIAFLSDGRYAVQTTGMTWVLSHEEEDRVFEPWRAAAEQGQSIPRTVDRTGKDWPHLPASDGEHIYLVCGRADGSKSNVVQKILPPREIDLPIVLWSLGSAGLITRGGLHLSVEEVLGEGMWEFQPGPLLIDDTLFVQARQWTQTTTPDGPEVNAPGEARAWLIALDARSGRPRWKRFLCRGTDVVSDVGTRFGREVLLRTPASALVATVGGIFVGTNLGVGCLVDLADGRLRWSLRNRRRPSEVNGWKGSGRLDELEGSARGAKTLLWAPADSDRLYALSPGLDFASPGGSTPAPLVPYPPLEIDESRVLVGGTPDEVLVLGRAGARLTLSAHDLSSGERHDSIYLAREERYFPGALVSPTHVLFAAERGIYLLDRERELYLAHHAPLRMDSDYASSGLWASGRHLFLLAAGKLWIFEAR